MAREPKRKIASRAEKQVSPTGIAEVDDLAQSSVCTIQDYIRAASAYVRQSASLANGPKKAGQIRLSNALARALAGELTNACPQVRNIHIGERKVSGALRTVNADVSEIHELDGLRLAVELKPVNLAVGRAIWNRFGDLRTFAVNLHLKFPFSVIGGVLVVPTYEETGTLAASEADAEEEGLEENVDLLSFPQVAEPPLSATARKSTRHLIERAVQRLVRAGGRKTEGDAPHLLEAIAVVAYDPESGIIEPNLPAPGTGLRWEEFVASLVAAYRGRFED